MWPVDSSVTGNTGHSGKQKQTEINIMRILKLPSFITPTNKTFEILDAAEIQPRERLLRQKQRQVYQPRGRADLLHHSLLLWRSLTETAGCCLFVLLCSLLTRCVVHEETVPVFNWVRVQKMMEIKWASKLIQIHLKICWFACITKAAIIYIF